MKKQLLIAACCIFFFGLSNRHLLNANSYNSHIKIIELKRHGWKVAETLSTIEERLGIKPYQNLKRVVQVVKYKLKKGKEVLFCIVEYDSQRDTIRESCNQNMDRFEDSLSR